MAYSMQKKTLFQSTFHPFHQPPKLPPFPLLLSFDISPHIPCFFMHSWYDHKTGTSSSSAFFPSSLVFSLHSHMHLLLLTAMAPKNPAGSAITLPPCSSAPHPTNSLLDLFFCAKLRPPTSSLTRGLTGTQRGKSARAVSWGKGWVLFTFEGGVHPIHKRSKSG